LIVEKEAVNEFQAKYFVELSGVVLIPPKMTLYHALELFSLDIRPCKSALVEQHFPDIPRQGISVPSPEMKDLVLSAEQTLETQAGKRVVDAGQPLGHSHVVRIFRFELKLEETVENRL
jgi:hypothetical protein